MRILFLLLFVSAFSTAGTISVHCPNGCPENPQGSTQVFKNLYAHSHNPVTKFANWVAYRVGPETFGPSSGRLWTNDPFLPPAEVLEVNDFDGVYNSDLRADKGHLAPSANLGGSRHRYELDQITNIVPQTARLNRGTWKALEELVGKKSAHDLPLYVITGPLYLEDMKPMPKADEKHIVPSDFFKVVYSEAGAIAFIMPQNIEKGVSVCDTVVPLSKVKELAGFQFPDMKESIELKVLMGCVGE